MLRNSWLAALIVAATLLMPGLAGAQEWEAGQEMPPPTTPTAGDLRSLGGTTSNGAEAKAEVAYPTPSTQVVVVKEVRIEKVVMPGNYAGPRRYRSQRRWRSRTAYSGRRTSARQVIALLKKQGVFVTRAEFRKLDGRVTAVEGRVGALETQVKDLTSRIAALEAAAGTGSTPPPTTTPPPTPAPGTRRSSPLTPGSIRMRPAMMRHNEDPEVTLVAYEGADATGTATISTIVVRVKDGNGNPVTGADITLAHEATPGTSEELGTSKTGITGSTIIGEDNGPDLSATTVVLKGVPEGYLMPEAGTSKVAAAEVDFTVKLSSPTATSPPGTTLPGTTPLPAATEGNSELSGWARFQIFCGAFFTNPFFWLAVIILIGWIVAGVIPKSAVWMQSHSSVTGCLGLVALVFLLIALVMAGLKVI